MYDSTFFFSDSYISSKAILSLTIHRLGPSQLVQYLTDLQNKNKAKQRSMLASRDKKQQQAIRPLVFIPVLQFQQKQRPKQVETPNSVTAEQSNSKTGQKLMNISFHGVTSRARYAILQVWTMWALHINPQFLSQGKVSATVYRGFVCPMMEYCCLVWMDACTQWVRSITPVNRFMNGIASIQAIRLTKVTQWRETWKPVLHARLFGAFPHLFGHNVTTLSACSFHFFPAICFHCNDG